MHGLSYMGKSVNLTTTGSHVKEKDLTLGFPPKQIRHIRFLKQLNPVCIIYTSWTMYQLGLYRGMMGSPPPGSKDEYVPAASLLSTINIGDGKVIETVKKDRLLGR